MSSNQSSSDFSLNNLIKDEQTNESSNSNNNQSQDFIRKTITLEAKSKIIENPLVRNNQKKLSTKINDTFLTTKKVKNENKNASSMNLVKNRLLYEKMKKKLETNKNNNSNLKKRINYDINKVFNSTFTSTFKKNKSMHERGYESKKSEKKLSKFINSNAPSKAEFNRSKRESLPVSKTGYKLKNRKISTVINDNDGSTTVRERRHSLNNTNRPILPLDEITSSFNKIKEKSTRIIKKFKKKKISAKEQALCILANSPVLRLCEQLIFCRSSKNIKNSLNVDTILKNHNIFLNAKANELQNEIKLCEKRIKTSFVASKIADITLNFITSNDEQEFKDFDIFETNQYVINEYYNYIKLLLILLNENYDNKLNDQQLKAKLFEKLKVNNFIYVRDYLYYIYIEKKEEFKVVEKIDIINELLKNSPKILNFYETLKICKFIAFSNYLIKEIISYANNMKDTIELKYRAENLLDIVMEKIDKMKKKNTLKSNKKNSCK
jgi:hypothetical protein